MASLLGLSQQIQDRLAEARARSSSAGPSRTPRQARGGRRDRPAPRASFYRPEVAAPDRIVAWSGPGALEPQMLNRGSEWMAREREKASRNLSASAGAALRKLDIYCRAFGVSEEERLPMSYEDFENFGLFMISRAPPDHPLSRFGHEAVNVETAITYISDIRKWHLAQRLPLPLSDAQCRQIRMLMRGLAREYPQTREAPRPPVTVDDLRKMERHVNLADPFDAAFWAAALFAFKSCARLGEVTVPSRAKFNPDLNATWKDVKIESVGERHNVWIALPKAKTDNNVAYAQSLVVREERSDDLDAYKAILRHQRINKLKPTDQVFAYYDRVKRRRFPMTKEAFMRRVKGLAELAGAKRPFGHSFRIGGTNYWLMRKLPVETVKLLGRWRSDAFEIYIRWFKNMPECLLDCAGPPA